MTTPFASPSVEPENVVVTAPLVPNVLSSVPLASTRVTDHAALLTAVSPAATILPSACNARCGKLEDHEVCNGTEQYPPLPKDASKPTAVGPPSAVAVMSTLWLPSEMVSSTASIGKSTEA